MFVNSVEEDYGATSLFLPEPLFSISWHAVDLTRVYRVSIHVKDVCVRSGMYLCIRARTCTDLCGRPSPGTERSYLCQTPPEIPHRNWWLEGKPCPRRGKTQRQTATLVQSPGKYIHRLERTYMCCAACEQSWKTRVLILKENPIYHHVIILSLKDVTAKCLWDINYADGVAKNHTLPRFPTHLSRRLKWQPIKLPHWVFMALRMTAASSGSHLSGWPPAASRIHPPSWSRDTSWCRRCLSGCSPVSPLKRRQTARASQKWCYFKPCEVQVVTSTYFRSSQGSNSSKNIFSISTLVLSSPLSLLLFFF